MSGGQLNANVDQYLQAAAMNTPPPQIMSDPLVTGSTPIEQLLRVLGIAANLSDPHDNALAAEQHAERDAMTREAAAKFAAQDEEAANELKNIDSESYTASGEAAAAPTQTAAMTQQLPQMASTLASSVAGAVGGILQPLAQIPQQVAQGMQQGLQTGMGLFQQAAGTTSASVEDAALSDGSLDEDFGIGTGDIDGLPAVGGADFAVPGAGGGGLGPVEGTAPTAYLGPPPVPSAGTAPSSAPITAITPAPTVSAAAPGSAGMAGMPMVPPGALAAGGHSEKEPKAETKRVSVPPLRNGAPVQGRLSVPPVATPVVRKIDGTPVVTRRTSGLNDTAGADTDL